MPPEGSEENETPQSGAPATPALETGAPVQPETPTAERPEAASAPAEELTLDGEKFDPQRAMATIKKLRESEKASKAQLKKLAEYEKADRERQDAAKSAEDKLADAQRQLEQASAERQDALLRAAVISKAAGRFVDVDAAYRLADLSGVTLEDDGSVTGLDEALETLAKSKPYLVNQPGKQPTPSLGPAAPKGKPADRTDDERRREYFGGGNLGFFRKREGGVVLPNE